MYRRLLERADALDMKRLFTKLWLFSHMSGFLFLFWRGEEENIDLLIFTF